MRGVGYMKLAGGPLNGVPVPAKLLTRGRCFRRIAATRKAFLAVVNAFRVDLVVAAAKAPRRLLHASRGSIFDSDGVLEDAIRGGGKGPTPGWSHAMYGQSPFFSRETVCRAFLEHASAAMDASCPPGRNDRRDRVLRPHTHHC